MTTEDPISRLQLKVLLREVHPAVRLPDGLSIADLHWVIQILMGRDDDHPQLFRILARDYGITWPDGPGFGQGAAAVPLSWFRCRP